MKQKIYAVVKHDGQWGIRARGAPFFLCDSFREALDTAIASANLLADQKAARMRRCTDDHPDDDRG